MHLPDFDDEIFDRQFKPVSRCEHGDMFDKCFALVFPCLQRDLCWRRAGPILRWDATFEFASKTMDDPEAEEGIGALAVLFGACNHVISFVTPENESDLVFQRMNHALKQRFKTLHPNDNSAINEIEWAHTDTCCGGCKNPAMRWFALFWPSATRAPFKDLFHGEKRVFDSTRGPSHDLHLHFVEPVKQSFLGWETTSKLKAFETHKSDIKKKRNAGSKTVIPQIGVEIMMKIAKYRKKILNFTKPQADIIHGLESAFANVQLEDSRLKAKATMEQKGYKSYVLKEVPGIRLGTQLELENIKSHVRKGCFDDPWGPARMSVSVSGNDDDPEHDRLRGTSGGESFNKVANRLVEDVCRQGADRGNQRLWMRVTHHNLQKDEKHADVLGIKKTRTFHWCLHAALLELNPNLLMHKDMDFPKPLPTGYKEWTGTEHNKQLNSFWVEVDAEFGRFETSAGDTSPSLPARNDDNSPPAPPIAVTNDDERSSDRPPSVLGEGDDTSFVTARQNALVAKKQHGPATTWSRKLGGNFGPRSVFNTFLPTNYELSQAQDQFFSNLLCQVVEVCGAANEAHQVRLVAQAWNQNHLRLCNSGSTGLGGLMREEHVKKLLITGARPIRAAAVESAPRLLPGSMTTKPTVKREHPSNVDSLTAREAAVWCQQLGIKVHRDRDERIKRLKTHGDQKENNKQQQDHSSSDSFLSH
jgi:hypothetical protein